MTRLSAHDLIRLWERGRDQQPVDQALTVLEAVHPGIQRHELASLPIGERDARLLAVHRQVFGGTLRGRAACPECGEELEFVVDIAELPTAPPPDGYDEFDLTAGPHSLRFRLPNSRDLAAVAQCADSANAHQLLIQHCIVATSDQGESIDAAGLPTQLAEALASRMVECDPRAEIVLDFECPGCGAAWQRLLDIVEFLWAEIAIHARRLLREVHTLARSYGWYEDEILALSSERRRAYLEMAG